MLTERLQESDRCQQWVGLVGRLMGNSAGDTDKRRAHDMG